MSEYIVTTEQLNWFLERMDETVAIPAAIAHLKPIIRCHDCKFAIINSLGDCKYCERFWDTDGDAQLNLPGDFFCAWGERVSE